MCIARIAPLGHRARLAYDADRTISVLHDEQLSTATRAVELSEQLARNWSAQNLGQSIDASANGVRAAVVAAPVFVHARVEPAVRAECAQPSLGVERRTGIPLQIVDAVAHVTFLGW
jgi:hypothetical protein